MTQPYSSDLRERVVRAHLAGEPIRQVAARFGVSVSSVPKWVARRRRPQAGALAGAQAPPRPGSPSLRGRDLDQDQHGTAQGLGAARPTPEGICALWPLAHHDLPRSPARRRDRLPLRLRRPHQHPLLPGLGQPRARPHTPARRHRHPRQSRKPQLRWLAWLHGLVELGCGHFRVDHSTDEFTNGTVHIKGIEGFWSLAKVQLAKFKGLPRHTFHLHLKETEWRFNHRKADKYKTLLRYLRQTPSARQAPF